MSKPGKSLSSVVCSVELILILLPILVPVFILVLASCIGIGIGKTHNPVLILVYLDSLPCIRIKVGKISQ